MKFTPENWKDIQRYYQGTFIKVQGRGDTLFRIDSVTPKQVSGVYNGGKEEFVLYLETETPFEVDYTLPNKSLFQYKNKALLLYRIPARQYFRGLSEENTRIVSIPRGEAHGFSWEVLTAYTEKAAFPSLKTVLSRGGESWALNRRFSYIPSTRGIAVDLKQIARFSDDFRKLEVISRFREDVAVLVQKDPFEVEIKGA